MPAQMVLRHSCMERPNMLLEDDQRRADYSTLGERIPDCHAIIDCHCHQLALCPRVFGPRILPQSRVREDQAENSANTIEDAPGIHGKTRRKNGSRPEEVACDPLEEVPLMIELHLPASGLSHKGFAAEAAPTNPF